MYLIFYQKRSGQTIFRIVNSMPILVKVGNHTSMGWYVLDIQFFDKNRFYTYETYRKRLDKHFDKMSNQIIKKKKIKVFFEKLEKILK